MQREAVAAIKYAGGTVRYEGEWEDGGPASSRGSWAPHWLVKAIGVDYFVRVKSVGLTGGAGDAEFAQVGRLGALVQLSLTPRIERRRAGTPQGPFQPRAT